MSVAVSSMLGGRNSRDFSFAEGTFYDVGHTF